MVTQAGKQCTWEVQFKLSAEVLKTDALSIVVAAGYEEAAAQGLVAGMNAARLAAGLSPVALPRNSSYIGTLIDDLVTKDLREPYRCPPLLYVEMVPVSG